MIEYDIIGSPIGDLLATGEDGFLTGLYFEAHKGGPKRETNWVRRPESFERVRQELAQYFAGELTEFTVPVRLAGTDFQKDVWKLLQAIPYGLTRSYGDLAGELGKPSASRAVGAAVGRNPVSIIVPCHRILGSTGTITGFAGGIERKARLLELERGF